MAESDSPAAASAVAPPMRPECIENSSDDVLMPMLLTMCRKHVVAILLVATRVVLCLLLLNTLYAIKGESMLNAGSSCSNCNSTCSVAPLRVITAPRRC